MHRPLRVPLYVRLGQYIKNLLLLNRNDWNKASDGLKMPSLSREEREKARPKPEQDLVRPREKPRARLDTFRGAVISDPSRAPQVSEPVASDSEVFRDEMGAVGGGNSPEDMVLKRRKKRRYRKHSSSRGSQGNGFFRRVFGKPSI